MSGEEAGIMPAEKWDASKGEVLTAGCEGVRKETPPKE